MNPSDFILSLIDLSGGISGRTLLQKRAFFVYLLTEADVKLGFDAHYYGPYSQVVDGTITELRNLGFISESSTGYGLNSSGFEMRRYDYSLTEDGKTIAGTLESKPEYREMQVALKRIKDAGDPDYVELSIAAKAYFILRKKKQPAMSCAEIATEAERFNWDIRPEAIARAADFLKKIELAK